MVVEFIVLILILILNFVTFLFKIKKKVPVKPL